MKVEVEVEGCSCFCLLKVHHGQTSEAFFVLFSGILFNVKWKHGQGCIVNVTIFSLF